MSASGLPARATIGQAVHAVGLDQDAIDHVERVVAALHRGIAPDAHREGATRLAAALRDLHPGRPAPAAGYRRWPGGMFWMSSPLTEATALVRSALFWVAVAHHDHFVEGLVVGSQG